jgi:hypothetical protein
LLVNSFCDGFQSTGASGKLIPRLVDATGNVGEPGELVPAEWNVFDVAQFLRVNDCAAYCDSFSRRVSLNSYTVYDGREINKLDLPCLSVHQVVTASTLPDQFC